MGKVCFVSKRKEEGTITQHRGCFSQNILENCHTPVTEHYGMRCCRSSMCNTELEIFLQGTGARSPPRTQRGEEQSCPHGWRCGWVSRSFPSSLGSSRVTLSQVGQGQRDVLGCPFLGCACRATIHGLDPGAEPPSPGPSPSTTTSTFPGPKPKHRVLHPPRSKSKHHLHAPIRRFPRQEKRPWERRLPCPTSS